jgi:hypothetical protein
VVGTNTGGTRESAVPHACEQVAAISFITY